MSINEVLCPKKRFLLAILILYSHIAEWLESLPISENGLRLTELLTNRLSMGIAYETVRMTLKTKLLFSAASFSWLMVFLSWRFDHGLIIIADWAVFALILTSIYVVNKLRIKEMKYIANPETMR